MWHFDQDKLKVMWFYYFSLIFLAACVIHDFIITGDVTGFSFGYIAAFIYFLFRTQEASRLLEEHDEER
jgi:hypothetical protein